jgi:Flp pilus assembly protein TadD
MGFEHIERAMALDPGDPLLIAISASYEIGRGNFAKAIDMQRRVVSKDPLSATARGNLGSMLMLVDQLPAARAELERALELSPNSDPTIAALADVSILQGRFDEALKVISQLPVGPMQEQRLAIVHSAKGDAKRAEEALAHVVAQAEKQEQDAVAALSVAEVFAMRKDYDRAFQWLDTAYQRSRIQPGIPRWGLRENLRMTPFLKPLHADPRWAELLAKPEYP